MDLINEPVETLETAQTGIILVQASAGKRFLNYIIDLIVFYMMIIGMGVIIGLLFPQVLENIDDESVGFGLGDRLVSMLFYGLYMFFVELIFRGKSLGKLITGTKAVNEHDGSEINFKTAFLRGIIRAIPFNGFSALGTPTYPWHDQWTNTLVIDQKLSSLTPAYLEVVQPSADHLLLK